MMSTKSLDTLMKETAGSSAIVFPRLSNKLWERESKETQGAQPNEFQFSWSFVGTGLSAIHTVRIHGSVDPMNIAARLICFRILEQLPDVAIFEAQEGLEQIREFYQQPSAVEQPRLPLPTSKATFLPTTTSPDYPWDDEEV
jgi:hypothetical protein